MNEVVIKIINVHYIAADVGSPTTFIAIPTQYLKFQIFKLCVIQFQSI